MEIWVFLAKNITQKPALQLHPGTLAVLVRYNQAQKCLQYDPKSFQYKLLQFFFKFIPWNFLLITCLMLSGKRKSITARAMGLSFSLFSIASSQDVPFGIPQCVQCMHHGLTFALLCVPFIFAENPRC